MWSTRTAACASRAAGPCARHGTVLRSTLVSLLCCPECRHAPLELDVAEREGDASDSEVQSGSLYCDGCGRFYFILDGVPRLISERYAELVDLSLARKHPEIFAHRRKVFDSYLALLRDAPPSSASSRWALDDVQYWDSAYGSDEGQSALLRRIAASTPTAGDRTLVRERHLVGPIRGMVAGKLVVDLGCGSAQAIRVLLDPGTHGYRYVGADLSAAVLVGNRRTMAGEFVQCSATEHPFVEGCADVLFLLGTLHHLPDQGDALEKMLGIVRPGGYVALHEVTRRSRLTEKLTRRSSPIQSDSAHNESIDLKATVATLSRYGTIVTFVREYTALRGLLTRHIADHMRSRPWLTALVLAVDRAFGRTVGRLVPALGFRAVAILARRHRVAEGAPHSL